MSLSRVTFEETIDRHWDAHQSVVLRYRHALQLGATRLEDDRLKALLEKTSIQEGLRIFRLLNYQGVDIHVLDETSLMHTHTLKSIDGCVTTAHCLLRGYARLATESGGNTATALAAYAGRHGLQVFCFVPEENLPLLDHESYRAASVHVIAVERPGLVKEVARRFAKVSGVNRVPETPWRYQAAMFIGCFLREHLLDDAPFDWLVQTISAGFGPIGIYRALDTYGWDTHTSPRFLGVQQDTNSPMYRAWKTDAAEVEPAAVASTAALLTQVMYDGAPQSYGTFPELKALLQRTRGGLTTLSRADFERCLFSGPAESEILQRLQENGVTIRRRDGDIVDKTGLMALAATLRDIASGRIRRGSRVLVCLTSGVNVPDGTIQPEWRVSEPSSIDDYARRWTVRPHA
jgi:threonine synthase